MSDAAMARCWGAAGYCTRAKREEQRACWELDELYAEQRVLERHHHHSWNERLREHARLREVNERIDYLQYKRRNAPSYGGRYCPLR